MARGVRKQEGEDFSPVVLDKIIELMAQDKPITKKVGCEMLNITYNPARLTKILDEYIATRERNKEMRKKMRNKPIDIPTASVIVSSYLSGDSLADISAHTFRSTGVIKNVLTKYNVPVRNSAVDYFNPIFLEDAAIADDYEVGSLVYSARYDRPATISSIGEHKDHGKVYGMWLHGDDRSHAYQPYYELADLRRVQDELKIEMKDHNKEEVQALLYEGLKNQAKQVDKRKNDER